MHYTESDYGRPPHRAFPEVHGIRPANLSVGHPPIQVTVSGANFKKSCEGLVNGKARVTVFGSPKTIGVDLTAKDLAEIRTLEIRVRNPDGVVSRSSVALRVLLERGTFPEVDPAGLAPANVPAGSGAQQVKVAGNYFQDLCTGLVNDQDRVTHWVSANSINVTLTAADVAAPANLEIRVRNPDGVTSLSSAILAVTPGP